LLVGFFLVIANISVTIAEEKKDLGKVFYRYVNEKGVKVVAQSMPPKYVPAGYEVVSLHGDVIKVVPPAPPASEVERIANEKKAAREQAVADVQLRRSYSTPGDIEAAKKRNLEELRGNTTILEANLVSARSQLKDQEAHAAKLERAGQKVSDDILNNINTLRAEEKDILAQIKQRQVEYQAASDKYDQDKKRFIEITATPKPQQN
jgi:hypothetical protein